MKISDRLAMETQILFRDWNDDRNGQSLALESFLGDIYSGLRVKDLDDGDREYAQKVLVILSGLHGLIRPLDGICPYRMEMGFKFSSLKGIGFRDLYGFWGKRIFDVVCENYSKNDVIVNLASEEFARPVLDFVEKERIVVAPKFLSWDVKRNEAKFVVVHAKIARGAFAHWMIKNRVKKISELKGFADLGYRFVENLSFEREPVFICEEFLGKGLSIKGLVSG